MKPSKQRKMMKAIQSNKARKHSDAVELANMQKVAQDNFKIGKYWDDYFKGKKIKD